MRLPLCKLGCTEDIGSWGNLAPKCIDAKEHTRSEIMHIEL